MITSEEQTWIFTEEGKVDECESRIRWCLVGVRENSISNSPHLELETKGPSFWFTVGFVLLAISDRQSPSPAYPDFPTPPPCRQLLSCLLYTVYGTSIRHFAEVYANQDLQPNGRGVFFASYTTVCILATGRSLLHHKAVCLFDGILLRVVGNSAGDNGQ